MTTVTFDSVELKNPSQPRDVTVNVLCNATRLVNGKIKVQSSAETSEDYGFACTTDTLADITNLKAKIGTKGSLVIGTDTITNCYISRFKWGYLSGDASEYYYEVGFVQETA